jgi:hypothetical protein
MAYVMGRPETGDQHIERIVALAERDAAREHSPPGD